METSHLKLVKPPGSRSHYWVLELGAPPVGGVPAAMTLYSGVRRPRWKVVARAEHQNKPAFPREQWAIADARTRSIQEWVVASGFTERVFADRDQLVSEIHQALERNPLWLQPAMLDE